MPPAGKYPRPNRHGAEGSGVWPRLVRAAVRRDAGFCWVCGHSGATTGDHDKPVTERPDLALVLSNIRAAHGGPRPCETCTKAAEKRGFRAIRCNEIKNAGSVDRARRIITERTGLVLPVGDNERPRKREEGREW